VWLCSLYVYFVYLHSFCGDIYMRILGTTLMYVALLTLALYAYTAFAV